MDKSRRKVFSSSAKLRRKRHLEAKQVAEGFFGDSNKKGDIVEPGEYPQISSEKQRKTIISNSQIGAKYKLDKSWQATKPLEKVFVDNNRLDLFIQEKEDGLIIGRPWLTLLIDEATRYPLGYHIGFEPPSSSSVINALEHAIYPKNYLKKEYPSIKNEWHAYGFPNSLKLKKNELISEQLKDICGELGITLTYTPDYRRFQKGLVEESYHQVNVEMKNHLNFYGMAIGSNSQVIGNNQLNVMIHRWLVDYYANEFIPGLGVQSLLWNEFVETENIRLPHSRLMFLPIEERTIQRTGINYLKLRYNSPKLKEFLESLALAWHEIRVGFRYDPSNLSHIYVYNHIQKQYFLVPCTNQDYSNGLRKDIHIMNLKKWLKDRKQIDIALQTAKAELVRIIRDEENKSKKNERKLQ
jgi:putative transposase